MQVLSGVVIGLLVGFSAAIVMLRKSRHTGKSSPQTATPTPRNAQPGGDEYAGELEELGKLTGELAHEIKNPLSTIKINLQLIREELERSNFAQAGNKSSDEQEQRFKRALRKIAVIEKETSRLEQILDGFLRYVDRTKLELARTDLNELVGDMVDFYSPQAYSHSITIRQGLHTEPLICKVDAGMLKQAILNLFINAQQAMAEGGDLIIRTTRLDDDAVIQISDTGSGIAPDRLPNIFKAYHSSRPQGRGFGLPTTKKIVDAHDGTIAVNSELGKGTCFTMKLPLPVTDNSLSGVSH